MERGNSKSKRKTAVHLENLTCMQSRARGVRGFASRSFLAGKQAVFCSCLQTAGGLGGGGLHSCGARLPRQRYQTLLVLLRGAGSVGIIQKTKQLHLEELPHRIQGGWTRMARKERVGCVGSPCDMGKPISRWAPESALSAAHPWCLPAGWSSGKLSSGRKSSSLHCCLQRTSSNRGWSRVGKG